MLAQTYLKVEPIQTGFIYVLKGVISLTMLLCKKIMELLVKE